MQAAATTLYFGRCCCNFIAVPVPVVVMEQGVVLTRGASEYLIVFASEIL